MPLFDAAGQLTAILCIAKDISPIKKAEVEFERLFNLMLDMACIVSSSGYFTKVNKVWTQTLGYSEQELLAVPSINVIHPDDVATTTAEVSRTRRLPACADGRSSRSRALGSRVSTFPKTGQRS